MHTAPEHVISELKGVTCCMGSHSVTCHPAQMNTPRHNPSQTGQYSVNLRRGDGRLSWPRWLVTYQDGLPAYIWSPHPDINPAAHGWKSNSQPVDHKSNALTTTLPCLRSSFCEPFYQLLFYWIILLIDRGNRYYHFMCCVDALSNSVLKCWTNHLWPMKTRSPATTKKQHVSCTCLCRLAPDPVVRWGRSEGGYNLPIPSPWRLLCLDLSPLSPLLNTSTVTTVSLYNADFVQLDYSLVVLTLSAKKVSDTHGWWSFLTIHAHISLLRSPVFVSLESLFTNCR